MAANCPGSHTARLPSGKAGCVKIIVEVQDLEPGRTKSYAVASYVRAVLKLRALRREVGNALLEVERRKKALNGRPLDPKARAEAQRLLDELGIEPDSP
jgi:hypothetical protein